MPHVALSLRRGKVALHRTALVLQRTVVRFFALYYIVLNLMELCNTLHYITFTVDAAVSPSCPEWPGSMKLMSQSIEIWWGNKTPVASPSIIIFEDILTNPLTRLHPLETVPGL